MTTVGQDNDNRRLERLETRMDSVDNRMGTMETRMGAMEARMGTMETRMGAMEVRMGAMEARMDAMWSILTELLADRRETNRRIDRLFYTLVGIGGGIIAALLVMIIRGSAGG